MVAQIPQVIIITFYYIYVAIILEKNDNNDKNDNNNNNNNNNNNKCEHNSTLLTNRNTFKNIQLLVITIITSLICKTTLV